MLNGSFKINSDLIWGSSFVNGLWLSIIRNPLLIWARIGYLISVPFIGVFIYLILKEFYNKRFTFVSVVFAFLFFNNSFIIYPVMNYYYLPVLASLVSFYFLVKCIKHDVRTLRYIILSGIFAGASVHLKFTYVLIIPAIIMYLFIFNEKNNRIKNPLYFLASFFSVLLLGFSVLLVSGGSSSLIYEHNRLSILDMIRYFIGISEVNSSLNYSASKLLNQYMSDAVSVIDKSLFPISIIAFSLYLTDKISKLKFLLIPVSGFMLYMYIFQSVPESHLKTISVLFSSSALILLSIKSRKKEFIDISYIFVVIFALSVLGTGTSFYGGIFSLGFWGFSSLVLISSVSYQFNRLNSRIIFPVLIILSILFQFLVVNSPSRDLPSSYLNTMFRSPELFGIYSFRERVDVVDEFMDFAKSEQLHADRVIIVGMPMLYFLLDINPIISETHDVLLGFEQLKKEVIEANPNVIVMPVQSPRGKFWPLPQNADFWTRDGFERKTAHYYEFYREYMRINNFNKEFENAMFAVYRKSELLREVAE